MLALLLTVDAATTPPACGAEPLAGAIAAYARAIETQDAAATAARYGEDGVMAGPGGQEIAGQAAVRDLLQQFSAFKVTQQRMTITATAAAGPAWRVSGRFDQQGTDPDGAAYHAQGRFDSLWACSTDRWRIKYMATTPDAQ